MSVEGVAIIFQKIALISDVVASSLTIMSVEGVVSIFWKIALISD